jgi:ABC-type glycerol-3-phosphate transport system substrate-binding protein
MIISRLFTHSLLFIFIFLLFFSNQACASKQLNWIGHWKGEGKREMLVEEVKKEFEFLNPGIKINLVYDNDIQGDGNYFKWNVANSIANMIRNEKIEWDVIFLGITVYNYVAELLDDPYWGQKHLVDFSTVKGFRETQKSFLFKSPYYKNQTGGIYVGPFIEGFISCLWYNTNVAQKVGLTIPSEGMTTTQFLEFAQQLSAYNKKNGTRIPFFNFSNFYRIEGLFEHIFKSHFKNPDHVVELSYSEEKAQAFLDTLTFFEQLSQYQPMLNEGWRNTDFIQYQKDFLSGGGLFIAAGTWMYGHFEGNAPQKMANGKPVEPPTAKYTNGLVGQYSNVWAVMKNSPNKDIGIELLKLWSEPKIAEKWLDYTKNPTGIKGHLSDLSTKRSDRDIYTSFVTKMTEKHAKFPMRNYRSPMYVFGKECKITGESFRKSLALILEGKKSANEYFTESMQMHNKPIPPQ